MKHPDFTVKNRQLLGLPSSLAVSHTSYKSRVLFTMVGSFHIRWSLMPLFPAMAFGWLILSVLSAGVVKLSDARLAFACSSRSASRCFGTMRSVCFAVSSPNPSAAAASATPKTTKPMSIAVVGSGAVGSYYGARLWEAGHTVKYLLRGENCRVANRNGLNVTSVDGDLYIPSDELQAFEDTAEMGAVDWVLVALKSSSLDAIPDLIYPLLDPYRTRVLAIMNGLIEEDLIRMLKEKAGQATDRISDPLDCCRALYGGMALVCSNRVGPAVVHHSYAGLLTGGVASSRSSDNALENEAAFRDLWQGNKVETIYESSLLRGRWKKVSFGRLQSCEQDLLAAIISRHPHFWRLLIDGVESPIQWYQRCHGRHYY